MQAATARPSVEDEMVHLIPALRAFALAFCRNTEDADDLVQETLVRGIASIGLFTPGTRLKSWLFTIMRNTFCTAARLAARERPGAETCASTQPTAQAPQEWVLRAGEVRAAIEELPTSQREIIVLIGVLGTTYEDAAEVCGCPVGTVKSRLNRARLTLFQRMGEASSAALLERDARIQVDANCEPEEAARA